jgi:type IV pilus assembly protein PilM
VVARRSDPEGDRGMDVIAVAARRDMVGALVEALREGGLQPAGIDLSAFGMIRALQPAGPEAAPGAAPEPAALFCHLGDLTNIAVARAGVCLMTRVAPYGIDDIAARVAERRAMPLEDASDWLVEVGLEEPLDSFDADREQAAAAREALEEGAAKLVDELRVSLDFFASQEGAPPVERVIVCGWGTTIPGLAERIQAGLGVPIEAMSPRALSGLGDEDAARLTVSYGLALGG